MTSIEKGNLPEDTKDIVKHLKMFLKSGGAEGPLSNKRTEESHVQCDIIVEQACAG